MRSFLIGTLLATALLVAGCGGSSSSGNGEATKTASRVLADTIKASGAARSFHLSGFIRSNHGPIVLDFSVANGRGAVGTIIFARHKVQMVIVGKNGYVKADTPGWSELAGPSGPMFARRLHGRWLKFPANNPGFQNLLDYTRPKALFAELDSYDSALANKGKRTYQGHAVVELHDEVNNGTLYVASSGPPYPLKFVRSSGSSIITANQGGTINFTDWNKPVTLTAPQGAVDLAHLNG